MKTAAKFFAQFFQVSIQEAKECNHLTLKCMEAYSKMKVKEAVKYTLEHTHLSETDIWTDLNIK